MSRSKTNLLISALLFLGITSFAFAAETITIDTYYPSPYGTYNTLRLYPRNDINPASFCSNAGEMFYHLDDRLVYYCNGAIWTPFGSISGLPQQQIFSSDGVFTVPAGITRIRVKMWGGGGGGGSGWSGFGTGLYGSIGGTTSFGVFIAYGGGGGQSGGPSFGGSGGIGGSYSVNGGATQSKNGVDGLAGTVGIGGPIFNPGGAGGNPADIGGHANARIPGGGGSGGDGSGANGSGGGGGGAGYQEQIINVTPGENYSVTVGSGGGIAAGSSPGNAGANGKVIVEW